MTNEVHKKTICVLATENLEETTKTLEFLATLTQAEQVSLLAFMEGIRFAKSQQATQRAV